MADTKPASSKRWRFLKDLDEFNVPVKMYAHRNDPDMKGQEQLDAYGSKFGGVITVAYYTFMLYYGI
jgi:hypothetical protein